MHQKVIQGITDEVCNKARDRFLGRILQLSPMSFVLDVGLRGVFLFVGAEPSSPRFYLIQRRLKISEAIDSTIKLWAAVKTSTGHGSNCRL